MGHPALLTQASHSKNWCLSPLTPAQREWISRIAFFFPFASSGNNSDELFEAGKQKAALVSSLCPRAEMLHASGSHFVTQHLPGSLTLHRSLGGNEWHHTPQCVKHSSFPLPASQTFTGIGCECHWSCCSLGGRQLVPWSCCCLEKDAKVKLKGLTPNNVVNYSLAKGGYNSITPSPLFSIKFVFKQNITA